METVSLAPTGRMGIRMKNAISFIAKEPVLKDRKDNDSTKSGKGRKRDAFKGVMSGWGSKK